MKALLTIGELAKRVGLRTSALRYYEEQGLLQPAQRSQAGYRLYAPQAERSLRFIQRAQRLGFALSDIHTLLHTWQAEQLNDETILNIAQQRYLELERQMTQSLVLQHELGLFLTDLRDAQNTQRTLSTSLDAFVERVCVNPLSRNEQDTFDWLLSLSGCTLNSPLGRSLLEKLRGQHIHVWQQEDGYQILLVTRDPAIGLALQELTALEADCQLHAQQHSAPLFDHNEEGFLLTVRGENAFIYVRLFLMLEGNSQSGWA